MTTEPSHVVAKARLDLQQRTLGRLSSDFARLVYLASTRNYNTGRYEHDGLSFHYSARVAEEVLAGAHCEVFLNLASSSLETLTGALERYIVDECVAPDDLFSAWNDLEAYRILVPLRQDALLVKIFQSNLKAALAIAQESCRKTRMVPALQYESRSPLPGR
jgi:hypothetical protein